MHVANESIALTKMHDMKIWFKLSSLPYIYFTKKSFVRFLLTWSRGIFHRALYNFQAYRKKIGVSD